MGASPEVKTTEITTIANRLQVLREEAAAMVVRDQDEYTAAMTFVKSLRAYKKDVGFKLDPGIESAKKHLEFLREEKDKYIRPIDELDSIVSKRAAEWREHERKAAEAEQTRINEERRRIAAEEAAAQRKAAEAEADRIRKEKEKQIDEARKAGELKKREADQLAKRAAQQAEQAKEQARKTEETAAQVKEVKVAPSIPKIAGIKGRTNWRFRIVNESLIPRKYLVPSEVAIGGMVRATKDKTKAEAECPGIEVYSEDSV